ncbi:hypothetical protein EXIGLDRAFT_720785 [Exidia glandulosa HHB12029]|uniref:Uncharacterized protein n=1 Tax=Exidia glandulosa HHB12029 TaxID=1314781 RepID=A0A165G482_EXIGL|nr:hypothetical protein EXIGLDRAFT_720785 [Exidia glandulosa HHB12029]
MITGVDVAGVLALLVLIILSYLVLRQRVPKRFPEDEYPMEVVSYAPLPSTATTSGKHLPWPPPRIEDVSGGHLLTSTSLAVTVEARSSLAPLMSEDIDRIAARVRDTLTVAQPRHNVAGMARAYHLIKP